jgi:hypothetical protein
MAKGLSRMKGNLHVRFLGGWRVVTLSGYPVGCTNAAPRAGWGGPEGRTPSTATHRTRSGAQRGSVATWREFEGAQPS